MAKRTTKVMIIETLQRTVIRRRSRSSLGWCEPCGEEAVMHSPEEFARLSGIPLEVVQRYVEKSGLHFGYDEDGSPLVCGNQLDANSKKEVEQE